MDLGIAGRQALLTASSRGLGKTCAVALAREGVNVTVNGLTPDHVDAAEDLIAQSDIVLTQFEIPPETVARTMALGSIGLP